MSTQKSAICPECLKVVKLASTPADGGANSDFKRIEEHPDKDGNFLCIASGGLLDVPRGKIIEYLTID